MEHHHDRRKDDSEVRLTRAFMRSVLHALRIIIHKLDVIIERLPERGKATKMELNFGEPEENKGA